jgi:hypothetical protein
MVFSNKRTRKLPQVKAENNNGKQIMSEPDCMNSRKQQASVEVGALSATTI